MTDSDNNSKLFRIGVKPPVFWPDKPKLWFAQLEGQFALANITSDATKFYNVISVLDIKHAAEVEDLIINPPKVDKYDTLKKQLIDRLSASRGEQLKQLLMSEELGDRKPSQFLRYIRSLAGVAYPDEFLRTLWTSRLPSLLQSIIAMQDGMPLDQVANLADRVHEASPTQPTQVAAASSSSALDAITQGLADLSARLEAMETHGSRRHAGRGRSHDRRPSRSRSSNDDQHMCWYHRRFKDKAAKCVKPCSYSKNS